MTHQKFVPGILLVSLFAVLLSSGCEESSPKVDPATKAKVDKPSPKVDPAAKAKVDTAAADKAAADAREAAKARRLDQFEKARRSIQVEAIITDYNQRMKDANKALSQGKFDPAKDAVTTAIEMVEIGKNILSADDYASHKKKAEDLSLKIEQGSLIEKLTDEDEGIRRNAAIALGKIGPAAKDAIPALTEALKDEDEEVRDRAQAALKKIKAVK